MRNPHYSHETHRCVVLFRMFIDVFSSSSFDLPHHHPLATLPTHIQSRIRAFARPQLPYDLRQHIARVHREGTQLAEWLVRHLCDDVMDTAVRQRTLVYPNTQPVYWTTPFAKVAPYVYREWTSATTVELSPYCAWKPILCDDRNTVVVWLVVQQVMAREWEKRAVLSEEEGWEGFLGVIHSCRRMGCTSVFGESVGIEVVMEV